MKKRLAILTLLLCMAGTMAACGNTKKDTAKTETKTETTTEESAAAPAEGAIRLSAVAPEEMEKYLTLGEYNGIDLEIASPEVTEEQIQSILASDMQTNAAEVTEADAVIEDGDIANIDYQGLLNGEAFEGGTDEGYDLTIGSGTFIEGFEDGLLGAKKGEERDLDLTFPEEYPSAELAGQAVVFKVKVNAIKRPQEITDDWVRENTSYQNLEEYKESIRKNYTEQNKANAEEAAKGNAWNQVYEASEVKEYPDADMEAGKKAYDDMMKMFAEQQGMSMEEFLKGQEVTDKLYEEQKQQYAEYAVKQNLIIQAIMDKEGLTFEGEAGQAALKDFLAEQGASSREELDKMYGERTVLEGWGVNIAGNFIMEHAKITESIQTADDKEGYDADAEIEAAE